MKIKFKKVTHAYLRTEREKGEDKKKAYTDHINF